MLSWLGLFKPGDWLIVILAVSLCAAAWPLAWRAGIPDKVIIKRGGEIYSELSLTHDRRLEVHGPLGTTTVVIEKQRVRVAADPGPRQYCVRQGWLSRAGEIAICAPNQVSVEIQGSRRAYDSLAY